MNLELRSTAVLLAPRSAARPGSLVRKRQTMAGCLVGAALALLTAGPGGDVTSAYAADPPRKQADTPVHKGGYAFDVTLRLGGPDAVDAAQFYERVARTSVDADARGNLYVLDDGNHRVQIFDPQGSFLRSVGSGGEGPGEFSMPRSISVNATGQFAVFDMGQQRISVFSAEGELLRDQLANGMIGDLVLRDDGTVVVTGRGRVIAYDTQGKQTWTYGEAPEMGGRHIEIETDFQTVASRLVLTSGGAILRADKGEYGVLRLDAKGQPLEVWARAMERQPFEMPAPPSGDDDERGEPVVVMIKRDGGGAGGGGGDGESRSWSADAGDGESMTFDMDDIGSMMPKFAPDVRGLLAWPDGRTWVITAADDGDRMVTDEWSAQGEYLRRFSIPKTWQSFAVGADGRLYAVTHDEEDYPIVHRLDVTPAL